MAGHSKWANIKHRKAGEDAKRAKVFTKFGKLITVAAQEGGGDPTSNVKLKMVIEQAKSVNMPKDNIERAIKRGTGELKEGAAMEEVTYEAYGPGNVAMLIKTITNNTNRTVSEVKSIIGKAGGKMVPSGSVGYLFTHVGAINILVPQGGDPYEMELEAIDAGAEDTDYAGDYLTVYTKMDELQKVKEALEKKNFHIESAGLVYIPLQKHTLDKDDKISYEKLLEKLDEQDDVQEIFDNL